MEVYRLFNHSASPFMCVCIYMCVCGGRGNKGMIGCVVVGLSYMWGDDDGKILSITCSYCVCVCVYVCIRSTVRISLASQAPSI